MSQELASVIRYLRSICDWRGKRYGPGCPWNFFTREVRREYAERVICEWEMGGVSEFPGDIDMTQRFGKTLLEIWSERNRKGGRGMGEEMARALGIVVRGDRIVVSSRDVARVFEKEHPKVLRDIRELSCPEEFRLSNFGQSSYLNEQGREMPEVLMARDGFTLLAMGYNGDRAMQFKIAYIAEFNRMERELNQGPAFRIPKTLPEALRLAAELEEQRAFLEMENRSLAPKALAWEVTAPEGSEMSLQALGKELARFGTGPRKIFEALGGMGVLYRLDGYWVPHQEHIDAKRFRVIRVNKVIEGEPRTCMKTLVTPKGRDYVAMLMAGRRAVA